ncbi:hypothetical protein GCM10027344_34300 [Spelaeicoccus albus]
MSGARRRWGWAAYFAGCLGLSALVYWPVLGTIRRRVFASSDDSSLFIWWLAHAARVIEPGGESNLLHTSLMNFPDGVNGAWNTSILGLALPMAPVTMLAGPVVAYNVLIALCPAVSALAGALALRRFMSAPSAGFGGILYGFSTYVFAQSGGHLNLAFATVPPIAVGVLYDVLYTTKSRRRIGVRTGLAAAFQLYLSTELLASTALLTMVAVIVVAVVDPAVRGKLGRRLVPTAGLGGVIAGILGIPLFVAMAGPGAPRQAIRPGGLWDTDLLGVLQPASGTLAQLPGPAYQSPDYIDIAERGAYLGVPLLIAVLIVVIAGWRGERRIVIRTTSIIGFFSWLLSLGSILYVAGAATHVVLPWRLIEYIPVLRNILPMRLAVFTALAVAILAGTGLDMARQQSRPSRQSRRFVRPAAAFAAAGLLALTIVPGPAASRPLNVPKFFADGAPGIEAGAIVKTVPRAKAIAEPHADEAMAWQAVAGMRYRSTGGYFIGSTADQPVIYQAPADGYDEALDDADSAGGLPPANAPTARAAGRALVAGQVDYVVVARNPWLRLPPADVARWTARITHSPDPVRRGGVWVVTIAGR